MNELHQKKVKAIIFAKTKDGCNWLVLMRSVPGPAGPIRCRLRSGLGRQYSALGWTPRKGGGPMQRLMPLKLLSNLEIAQL